MDFEIENEIHTDELVTSNSHKFREPNIIIATIVTCHYPGIIQK